MQKNGRRSIACDTEPPVLFSSHSRFVQGRDKTAARGCGERIFGEPDFRHLQREAVALDDLTKLVQEPFWFCGPAAQDDRDRLVDLWKILCRGKLAANRLDKRQRHVLVVDVKRALVFVLRRTRQIEALFLDRAD